MFNWFKQRNQQRRLKKIFQWEDYLNWKDMNHQQRLNLKRALLFPVFAYYYIFIFLKTYTYAILLFLLILFIIRYTKRNKISK